MIGDAVRYVHRSLLLINAHTSAESAAAETDSMRMNRWATNKVDEKVVNPVATRLATSVANPHVLSFLIWERIKTMTPQRARDVTRLLSTAVANALGVLGAEKGKALTGSAKVRDWQVSIALCRIQDALLTHCLLGHVRALFVRNCKTNL